MEKSRMLTQKDWKSAIDVQDACNLSAVVHAWSVLLTKLWKEAEQTGEGTDWVNKHPLCVMYASKVASLTGAEDVMAFCEAYDRCHLEIANIKFAAEQRA